METGPHIIKPPQPTRANGLCGSSRKTSELTGWDTHRSTTMPRVPYHVGRQRLPRVNELNAMVHSGDVSGMMDIVKRVGQMDRTCALYCCRALNESIDANHSLAAAFGAAGACEEVVRLWETWTDVASDVELAACNLCRVLAKYEEANCAKFMHTEISTLLERLLRRGVRDQRSEIISCVGFTVVELSGAQVVEKQYMLKFNQRTIHEQFTQVLCDERWQDNIEVCTAASLGMGGLVMTLPEIRIAIINKGAVFEPLAKMLQRWGRLDAHPFGIVCTLIRKLLNEEYDAREQTGKVARAFRSLGVCEQLVYGMDMWKDGETDVAQHNRIRACLTIERLATYDNENRKRFARTNVHSLLECLFKNAIMQNRPEEVSVVCGVISALSYCGDTTTNSFSSTRIAGYISRALQIWQLDDYVCEVCCDALVCLCETQENCDVFVRQDGSLEALLGTLARWRDANLVISRKVCKVISQVAQNPDVNKMLGSLDAETLLVRALHKWANTDDFLRHNVCQTIRVLARDDCNRINFVFTAIHKVLVVMLQSFGRDERICYEVCLGISFLMEEKNHLELFARTGLMEELLAVLEMWGLTNVDIRNVTCHAIKDIVSSVSFLAYDLDVGKISNTLARMLDKLGSIETVVVVACLMICRLLECDNAFKARFTSTLGLLDGIKKCPNESLRKMLIYKLS